jgi:hypothetical protein
MTNKSIDTTIEKKFAVVLTYQLSKNRGNNFLVSPNLLSLY